MKIHATIAGSILLASCATPIPQGPVAPPAWAHAPTNSNRLSGEWWRSFNDPKLNALIQQAWKDNPEVEATMHRVEAARADRFESLAQLFPKAGISLGRREGREQNRSTDGRPMDLEPWTADGGISWELDLTGKLRARARAAKSGEAMAHARWQGSRLLVATEVCAARFETSLLSQEIHRQNRQIGLEKNATRLSSTLLEKGLISSKEQSIRVSHLETLRREVAELTRLRDKASLRLQRLLGGSQAPEPSGNAILIPTTPKRVPAKVWQSRPDLIAAEARVRQAFALKDASTLDLLPSLSLRAGGDLADNSLSGDYRMWTASVGPLLEIPIWDPARIATVKRQNAKAAEASADFRTTANRAVEEIEAAYVDLSRYRQQLASFERESGAKLKAWNDAQAKYESGLESALTLADHGRSYRRAAALTTRMRLRALNAHLRLIRALGG